MTASILDQQELTAAQQTALALVDARPGLTVQGVLLAQLQPLYHD